MGRDKMETRIIISLREVSFQPARFWANGRTRGGGDARGAHASAENGQVTLIVNHRYTSAARNAAVSIAEYLLGQRR